MSFTEKKNLEAIAQEGLQPAHTPSKKFSKMSDSHLKSIQDVLGFEPSLETESPLFLPAIQVKQLDSNIAVPRPPPLQIANTEMITYSCDFSDELAQVFLYYLIGNSPLYNDGGCEIQSRLHAIPKQFRSRRADEAHTMFKSLLENSGYHFAFSRTPNKQIVGYIAWRQNITHNTIHDICTYPSAEIEGNNMRMVYWLATQPQNDALSLTVSPSLNATRLMMQLAEQFGFEYDTKTQTLSQH